MMEDEKLILILIGISGLCLVIDFLNDLDFE